MISMLDIIYAETAFSFLIKFTFFYKLCSKCEVPGLTVAFLSF